MLEPAVDFDLSFEAEVEVVRFDLFLEDDFDGDLKIIGFVFGEVDIAVLASAEEFDELEISGFPLPLVHDVN